MAEMAGQQQQGSGGTQGGGNGGANNQSQVLLTVCLKTNAIHHLGKKAPFMNSDLKYC